MSGAGPGAAVGRELSRARPRLAGVGGESGPDPEQWEGGVGWMQGWGVAGRDKALHLGFVSACPPFPPPPPIILERQFTSLGINTQGIE